MKHIYKGLAFCAALAFAHTHIAAQKRRWPTWWKRLKPIRFRRCKWHLVRHRNDLLGGVSVIDMKEGDARKGIYNL